MKRVICLLLCVLLLLSGCAGGAEEITPSTSETTLTAAQGGQIGSVASRRQLVVNYMRSMLTVKWTTDETITYSLKSPSWGPDSDGKSYKVTLYAGRVYQGIPYTHGDGAGYSFLLLDEDGKPDSSGVYELSGLTAEALTGYPAGYMSTSKGDPQYNVSRLGSDCADAVYWAWAQISSSITFESTRHMTKYNGCVYIGDYDMFGWDDYNGTGQFPVSGAGTTHNNVCVKNGKETMYKAYSLVQLGDALVYRANSNDGHVVMVSDVHVEYNADGTVNAEKSYVLTLDQTSTLEKKQNVIENGVYVLEKLDKKRTFAELFEDGYLPMSCEELLDTTSLAGDGVADSRKNAAFTRDTMFSGNVTANYRIAYVTVTITNKSTGEKLEITCFNRQETMDKAPGKDTFELERFRNAYEQAVLLGGTIEDINGLAEGNYHCTLACRLSNGNIVTFREFDFS